MVVVREKRITVELKKHDDRNCLDTWNGLPLHQNVGGLEMAFRSTIALALVIAAMSPGAASTQQSASRVCKPGYVWREAYPNDTVCVLPATRTQVRADNRAAASRINPRPGRYRPNECKPGFVWRIARPSDLVCVVPSQRDQAQADNKVAAYRRVGGPPITLPGRPRVVAVGANGALLPNGAAALAQCRIGGVVCPKRMQPLYDEVTVQCLRVE